MSIDPVIYYLEGWNIYWEVSLSAQRMRVSNACNTELAMHVIRNSVYSLYLETNQYA